MTALAAELERHGLTGPALYSRILELESPDRRPAAAPDLSSELLLEQGMKPYEAELRNQIRQALRQGLRVSCSLPCTEAEVEAAYSDFVPLHRESWERTGMTPHPAPYWTALARAILDAGGRDMVVLVRDAEDVVVAGVTCHLRGGRALYWAGASSEQGLRQRANPLCLHAAIQAGAQLGAHHFELGRFDARERSSKELAISRYKAQFGGELVRIVGFQTRPPLVSVALRRARALLTPGQG